MKSPFILVTLILTLTSIAHAEIWKCQKEGEQAAQYTDTPTGGDGINCEKVETIRFSKTGEKQGQASTPQRSYSPPSSPHTITKVRAKVKAATAVSKPLKEEHSSLKGSSNKNGNQKSGMR